MKNVSASSVSRLASILLVTSLAACAASAPDSGELTAQSSGSSTYQHGVPGGVTTTVSSIVATVAQIDYNKRTVQLVDAQGNRKTLDVGPEAVNFNQIKKGDTVKIAFIDELVIYLRDKNSPAKDDAAGVIARAPAGEKPQGIVAGTAEMTAVVKAIDVAKHTATLQLPDGRQETVPVREDVKLDKSQVGREVTFRLSRAVAVSVEAPQKQ